MRCKLIVGHECHIDDEEKKCNLEEVQSIFYMNFQRTLKLYGREITLEALQWLVEKIKKEKNGL